MNKLRQPQGRGDFFKSIGSLLAGIVAEQVSDAITGLGPKLLRPPGALDELEFLTACTRCDKCIHACPHDVILKAGSGAGLAMNTPFIDPRSMPCLLCSDLPCVTACPDGALVWPKIADQEARRAVRMGTAEVSPSRCLTYDISERAAMECRACLDRCPFPGDAIRMEANGTDAFPHPVVNPDSCTGCGQCVFVCPTLQPAIVVVPRG
jgi:ferredoxin-type protein NapG